jgi:hypothetical protein
MKFIKGNIYSRRRVQICDLLNWLLHEILVVAPAIKLSVFLGEVNMYLPLSEHSKNYDILY